MALPLEIKVSATISSIACAWRCNEHSHRGEWLSLRVVAADDFPAWDARCFDALSICNESLLPGMDDPWKTLRILPTRDLEKIKIAYRTHAQKFHPDKAPTLAEKKRYTLRFIELREAYTYAKLMAQYEPDLQPPTIRRPPDLSENALLSRDWFVAAVAIVAGVFGFWLIWVSAEHVPHYAVHMLSLTPSIFKSAR